MILSVENEYSFQTQELRIVMAPPDELDGSNVLLVLPEVWQ